MVVPEYLATLHMVNEDGTTLPKFITFVVAPLTEQVEAVAPFPVAHDRVIVPVTVAAVDLFDTSYHAPEENDE